MIDYLKYFFNPSHFFSLRPQAMETRAIIILAVIFAVFIALGVVTKILSKKTKDGLKLKGLRRLVSMFLTMGIIGFVYLFFAWQAATLLASRFWLIIWLFSFLLWLFFILKYLFSQAPKMRREIDRKRDFERYIP
jgi:glucan phosphoethanolaminetransferase (alkaline phosphatase superfamily)